MRFNVFVLLLLFLLSQTCIISYAFLVFVIIGEVNRKLPDDKQISYFGFHPLKYWRILQEYRRFYPGQRLVLYSYIVAYTGAAFFIVFMWRFGLF